jgi:hypothetical protein
MASNHLQQRSSTNHAASNYTNTALSPPSISTNHTAATSTPSSSANAASQQLLQSPPSVPNTTNSNPTLRQRRMMNHNNNKTDNFSSSSPSSLSSSSISEVCTDTYQCLCLLPVYPNYKQEYLEYHYTNNNSHQEQPSTAASSVRIRQRGEYYIDSFNDQSKSFTFGTNENVRWFLLHGSTVLLYRRG